MIKMMKSQQKRFLLLYHRSDSCRKFDLNCSIQSSDHNLFQRHTLTCVKLIISNFSSFICLLIVVIYFSLLS